MSRKASPAVTIDQLQGRDSLNLIEFPLALLADRSPKDLHRIEFSNTVLDPKTKMPIEQKLIISTPSDIGLPTATDDEVLLALLQLTKLRTNFKDPLVHFSRYEIIQLLGWPDSGASYRRLSDSFDRWSGAMLRYDNAWWDATAKRWVSEKFHVIAEVTMYEDGADRKQASLPFSSFRWGEPVFRSFGQNLIKQLDLTLYFGIDSRIAKRIYRFLDKQFYQFPRREYDLAEFAFDRIGMSRNYHTGRIKEKLTPGIRELEVKGFLKPLPLSERYIQIRRGIWKVVFIREGNAPNLSSATPPVIESTDSMTDDNTLSLVKALADRGVTVKVAERLTRNHSSERIRHHLDVFDWHQEQDSKLGNNPAGYLVKSIEDDYKPPKGYTPQAEREAAKQRVEAARRKKQEEKDAERREQALNEAKNAHIRALRERLSDEELIEIEDQVIEECPDEQLRRELRARQGIRRFQLNLMVDEELCRRWPFDPSQTT